MRAARHAILGSAAVLACLAAAAGYAQVQRAAPGGGDGGEAVARLQQQVQSLSAAKAQAEASAAQLRQENESLKQQLAKATGDQDALQQHAAALEAANRRSANTEKQNAIETGRLKGQMQELIGRFRETAENLQKVETDRSQLQAQLKAREQEVKACGDRNARLYELNGEILDRMENRGFWAAVAEHEPFTQIARTRLENLADDYRTRAAEQRQPDAAPP
jgi:chromosome segregation ATPase